MGLCCWGCAVWGCAVWGCAVWGCAGVTESTGASCQRNDKTDTGKFSEYGKAQRGDKNVGRGFVSVVWRRETPHKLLYLEGG